MEGVCRANVNRGKAVALSDAPRVTETTGAEGRAGHVPVRGEHGRPGRPQGTPRRARLRVLESKSHN